MIDFYLGPIEKTTLFADRCKSQMLAAATCENIFCEDLIDCLGRTTRCSGSHDHHLEVVHLFLHHLLLLHHHLHPKQPESLQVCEQHLDALLPVASAELL